MTLSCKIKKKMSSLQPLTNCPLFLQNKNFVYLNMNFNRTHKYMKNS